MEPSSRRPERRAHGLRGREPDGFGRLAVAHAASIAADTLVTLALADSVFFGISPTDARPRVLLYLLLTAAPFAVVAPLLGPWIDSAPGGRRLMLMASAGGRAVVALLLIGDINSLPMFPEAFALLVLSKAHQVARSALVPAVVRGEHELVEANSKLAVISAVVGLAVAGPGLLCLWVGGAPLVLAVATVAFAATTALAWKIPKVSVAPSPADEAERAELRGAGVLLAATAMASVRSIVGFLTFHVAFLLRSDAAPTWWFGVVIGVSALGGLTGSAGAAPLRRHLSEERMLLASLVIVTVVAAWASWQDARVAVAVLAATVGVAAATAKTAFDAIVQRDAPDANQGRSFARFETRFQLVWVAGAVVPVIVHLPGWVGSLMVAVAAGFAALSYGGVTRLGRWEDPAERIRRRFRSVE